MDPNVELLNVGVAQAAPPIGILLCGICNSTLRRHIAYCRRTQNRPKVRPKPCRECKAAKSKCSLQQSCVRCVRKGLACVYPEPAANQANRDPTGALVPTPTMSSAIFPHRLDPKTPSYSIGGEQFWETPYKTFETLDALLFPSTAGFAAETEFLSTTRSNDHVAGLDLPRKVDQVAASGILNDCVISTPTQLDFPLGSLRRPGPASENCATIIKQALGAFPQMMLRRSTFPPFIHPQRDKRHLPAPLASCMAISGLFASRNDDTRPILWKTVREEQELSVQTITTFPRRELLAAMQAQMIYITMRVVDGFQTAVHDREYNSDMLFAYKAFCNQYMALQGETYNAPADSPPDVATEWENWVMDETLKRTFCAWFLFAQVSSISIGIPCTILDDWLKVPLPCHKAQWAARTPEEWKQETEAIRNLQNQGSGPATFGDLCDLHRGTPGRESMERLSVWNAGADNIGFLLNLAVTMF